MLTAKKESIFLKMKKLLQENIQFPHAAEVAADPFQFTPEISHHGARQHKSDDLQDRLSVVGAGLVDEPGAGHQDGADQDADDDDDDQ